VSSYKPLTGEKVPKGSRRSRIGYKIGGQTVKSHDLNPKDWLSECVEALEYDMERQQLTVHFEKRGSYVYFDVTPDVYAEFNNAGSRGQYFNMYIRGRYEYERLS
jgi:KTSC domain